MDGLTEAELAQRAGTNAPRIRRLVELGIVSPDPTGAFRPTDVQRIRFADVLEASGISLDDIGSLIATGRLSFSFIDLLFPTPAAYTGQTYEQLCADRGMSMDVVETVHEAVGLPRPSKDDPVREDDAAMFPMAQFALALGIDQAVLGRVLRVYGENLRRIAQAEPDFYHSYVELPLLGSGMTEAQMRMAATEMSTQLIPIVQRMVLWLYQRHFEHYTIEHTIEHVESAMEEAGMERRREARPPAIAFLDLSGYTALTEERGDLAAAELATNLAGLVQSGAARHGGRPVKWLGDGVMFHFVDAHEAILCALELVEEAPAAGMPSARVGLHAGPVIFRDGDYFGRTVNIAARIAARARPDEVLVSDDAMASAGDEGVRYESIGPVGLKGVSHPIVLHRAIRAAGDT